MTRTQLKKHLKTITQEYVIQLKSSGDFKKILDGDIHDFHTTMRDLRKEYTDELIDELIYEISGQNK